MKKIILGFAFLGLFTFATPKVTNACNTIKLTCNGQSHYVIVCDWEDINTWIDIYCNPV